MIVIAESLSSRLQLLDFLVDSFTLLSLSRPEFFNRVSCFNSLHDYIPDSSRLQSQEQKHRKTWWRNKNPSSQEDSSITISGMTNEKDNSKRTRDQKYKKELILPEEKDLQGNIVLVLTESWRSRRTGQFGGQVDVRGDFFFHNEILIMSCSFSLDSRLCDFLLPSEEQFLNEEWKKEIDHRQGSPFNRDHVFLYLTQIVSDIFFVPFLWWSFWYECPLETLRGSHWTISSEEIQSSLISAFLSMIIIMTVFVCEKRETHQRNESRTHHEDKRAGQRSWQDYLIRHGNHDAVMKAGKTVTQCNNRTSSSTTSVQRQQTQSHVVKEDGYDDIVEASLHFWASCHDMQRTSNKHNGRQRTSFVSQDKIHEPVMSTSSFAWIN